MFSKFASLTRFTVRALPRTYVKSFERYNVSNNFKICARNFAEEAKHETQISPYRQTVRAAKKTTKTALILTCVGVGVAAFAYMIIELAPNQMSTNSMMSDSLKLVRKEERVLSMLGSPIKAYGQDIGSESRRSAIEKYEYTGDDGKAYRRIRYTIQGPSGNTGHVYVEKCKGMPQDEYNYLIIQIDKPRVVKIVLQDHREVLSQAEKQDRLVKRLNRNDSLLFIRGRDKKSIRQLEEFGNSADGLQVIDCENQGDLCNDYNIKSTPTWRIAEKQVEGFQSYEQLYRFVCNIEALEKKDKKKSKKSKKTTSQ